jgi:uncharacterized damage-inducible protein DinB
MMGSDLLPWLEYRWAFDFPTGMYRAFLARLRGAPPRLEDLVRGISKAVLTRNVAGKWSAQEHAGHFLAVEQLFQTRIGEFLRGATTLSAADMSNRATNEAEYNMRPIGDILVAFRAARGETLAMLDPLTVEDAARVARHPRLDRQMRLVDLCFFFAEHDDHHLALIHQLTT